MTKKNEEKFHQFHSLRFDSDYRDIEHSDEPSTFLTMCIANSGEVSVFNRKNLKFQDYLANICGVIKTLKVLFGIFIGLHHLLIYFLFHLYFSLLF